FGILVCVSSNVQAQWGYGRDRDYRQDDRYRRNDDRYRRDDRYGYNNSYQIARQQGYNAGVNTGASDAQRGQSYSPQRSHYWREARTQAFRSGFEQGYDQGFRQYAYQNGGYNNGGYGNGGYRTGNTVNVLGAILGQILSRPRI